MFGYRAKSLYLQWAVSHPNRTCKRPPRGAKILSFLGTLQMGKNFLWRHIMLCKMSCNAGHDLLKRSNGYSSQTNYPKEEPNYLSQILLTYFSQDYYQQDRRVKNNVLKQSYPCVRRLLLKNFLEELKTFWEPGSAYLCSSASTVNNEQIMKQCCVWMFVSF